MRREFLISAANHIAEMHELGRHYVNSIDGTIAAYNDLILTVQAEILVLEGLKNTMIKVAVSESTVSDKIKAQLEQQQSDKLDAEEQRLKKELETNLQGELAAEVEGQNQ